MDTAADHLVEPVTQRTPWLRVLRLAGAIYPISWVLGLAVFSSSTQVRSTGAAVLSNDTGHVAAASTQFVLTEGLPGLILGLVAWHLGRMASGTLRTVLTVSGLSAAAVSLAQCGIGLWITAHLTAAHLSRIGALSQAVNRMDGVKMLLLSIVAIMAWVVWRFRGGRARWFGWLALGTAATLTASGFGYLLLDNTLATAAWISLPLLICFIDAVTLTRPEVGERYPGDFPRKL